MDYSTSIDEDLPAGASPWGSSPTSSPEHHRTTFADIADETHSPPFGFGFAAHVPDVGLPHDEADFGPGDDESDLRRPDTASTVDTQPDESSVDDPTQESENQGLLAASQQQPSSHEPAHDPAHEQARERERDRDRQRERAQEAAQDRAHENTQEASNKPGKDQAGQSRRPTQTQFKLQAKITGLERTGRKDPILRFDVHTNVPSFRTTQYRDVRRLHSEFGKLAEHLISANPEAIVPAVPPALTSAGAGTEEDEARVKALMQRWFQYVCGNEVLMKDDEMVLFVESDFGYSPMVKRKQPATGVRRKILKQFAPPPDDTPELQEARPIVKLFYLGTMDAGHKVDKLVKARRGLGLAESDFGVKLGSMCIQEPHAGLANAYRRLGKVIQTVGDCHAAQATAEATTIGDPFQHHSQDAFIVKETLTNRQILMREFLQAQEATRSKLGAADRLRSSSNVRRDKVDEAISSLNEAQQNESYLYQKTTRVTQNLVHERRKWFARTAADLRLSIREYVIREIEAERRILALMETVRPDIRAIDASGGLSRLGRESHPTTMRRTSLASSQGPKGDAWSGVPRRDNLARSLTGTLVANMPESAGDAEEGGTGRGRGLSAARAGALPGLAEEDDEDRVDARNAASKLASSTF